MNTVTQTNRSRRNLSLRSQIATLLLAAAAVHANADEQAVKVYTTAVNGPYLQTTTATLNNSTVSDAINFQDGTKYQSMDGFGAAITYSTAYNLLKMSESDRNAFLKKTYSTTSGYGYSYARIAIGCSDFSSTEFTCCDTKGPDNNLLQYFGLHSDDTNYIIPILKKILAYNPNIKIIATPWTCPKWMKIVNPGDYRVKDSWTDGHLNDRYDETYAEYFIKWINAMKANGIPIYAVTPQNEPLNTGNCASLYMRWDEEARFVKVLARKFKAAGLTTKIYLWDHNYNYTDPWYDENDYPVKVFNALGTSFEGSELVVGSAYHNYGGSISELDDIHNQLPGKELIFTETSIGTWNNGSDLSKRLVNDMNQVVLGTVSRYCKAVMVWNLMLDDNYGPNLSGGCQTCNGAVDISRSDYKTIRYNSHYYIIAHMSAVVSPGARRIATNSFYRSGLSYLAFLNPDGTHAVVLSNSSGSAINVPINSNGKSCQVNVPANGVVSVRFIADKKLTSGLWIIGEPASIGDPNYTSGTGWNANKAIQLNQVSQGIYEKELVAGTQLNCTNVNFKFFLQAGWGDEYQGAAGSTYRVTTTSDLVSVGTGSYDNGNIKLKSGKSLTNGTTYRVRMDCTDANNAVLTFEPVQKALTSGLWIIGEPASIGDPTYTSGTGWNANKAIQLNQVSQGIYEKELVAGTQLNCENVNFKFFLQAGWGDEYQGAAGSTYRVTTTSDLVSVGTGSYDNGNIKLKSGKTLSYGTTYRLRMDCTNAKNAVFTLQAVKQGYTGGVRIVGSNASIGNTAYTAGNYGWSLSNALVMAQTAAAVYEIDLLAGTQLNCTYLNFKFFRDNTWNNPYSGAGSNYKVTSGSSLIRVGDGTGGSNNDNGNIYLQNGKSLVSGTVYRLRLDCTDANNAVVTLTPLTGNSKEAFFDAGSQWTDESAATGVKAIDKGALLKDAPAYNLQGMRVGADYRGIVIVNGKKVVR